MRRIRSTPAVVAIALTVVCCMLAPAAANADSVTANVCTGDAWHASELGFTWDGLGPFDLLADCPNLHMTMVGPGAAGERVAFSLPVPASLTNVAATLSGGPAADSGVVFRMRVCSFMDCGRTLTPGASGLPAPGELTLADGIPEDPITLLIEEECARPAGCEVQPDTVISDLTLSSEIVDTTAPVIHLTDAWETPYSSTTPMPIEPLDYVYFYDADGAETMWWTVDDGPVNNTTCWDLPDDPPPINCGFLGMIRPPAFEGVIKLTVYAADAFGNVGSAVAMLSHDSTPPAAPEDLTIDDGDGWINQYEFTANWTNTDTDVAHARYEIRDVNGQFVKGGTFDGDQLESIYVFVSEPGTYTLTVRLIDEADNEGPPSSVQFRFDWIPPASPIIASIPVVNSDYVDTGITLTWSDWIYWDTSFSGVCEYRTAINSLKHYEPTTGADVTTVPFATSSIVISPEQLATMADGVRYLHVAGTSCAGVDGPASDATFVIDRKPPTVSSVPASGGWLAPGKPLVLRAEDTDPQNSFAGVSSITWSVDGGAEHVSYVPKASILLSQGMHEVTYYAKDVAGNVSAPATIVTGVDAQAPTAAFNASDPSDPALITASVVDSDSGVDDAWFEYRPPGAPTWARLVGTAEGDSPRTLKARFPDDDSLPSGEYQLRIVARDKAGNTGTTTSRVDGSPASLTLPLRRHAALTLAVAPGQKAETSNSLTVRFNGLVIARGTLRDPDGAPLAGALVALSQSVSGGQPRQFSVVTTDADGAFAQLVPNGPSRVVIANFRGDSLRGSASASATFNVRAKVMLNRPPKLVRSGKRFYLRGRVDPGLAALPKVGARVVIQHRSGSRWSGLVVSKRTTSNGTFEIPWTQNTKGRPVRMVFRAAVEPEAGWPYASGYSKPRAVVIR